MGSSRSGVGESGVADPVVDAARAVPFDTRKVYEAAIKQVRAAAEAYLAGGELLVDDAVYDALVARLTATEAAQLDWRAVDSPTTVVAAGMGVVGEVEHSEPMLSLDYVFDEAGLRAWATRLERMVGRPVTAFTVEPKIDGLAVAATYTAGELLVVATRGDGPTGGSGFLFTPGATVFLRPSVRPWSPPAASQRPTPTTPCCIPTRDVRLTRHQQGSNVVNPSGLPLTCDTRSERASLGFPLSFAPSRYRPRTSGRGQVWNTDPSYVVGITPTSNRQTYS
jgi:NAD-dependent DNA ligase adenylation domain